MRVMVIVWASLDSEAGKPPTGAVLAEMGRYNEELVKAGVLLAAEGLHGSARGKRVRFAGRGREVLDGPFADTREQIAGFWLWQVRSMEEAVAWVKRMPCPTGGEGEVEIRPVLEAADFAPGEHRQPSAQAR